MSLKDGVKRALRRAAGQGEPTAPAVHQRDTVQGTSSSAVPADPARRHPPDLFAHLLACPHCHGALRVQPNQLTCAACGRSFELLGGVPVLLPEARDVRVVPLDHESNAVGQHHIEWLSSFDGFTLNIGAGATRFKLPTCLELEYAVFRNTDVVGDAHRLPFASNAFDAILTLNTFEHLSDPELAASEVRRVLRPGGQVLLQTAFLQPLHEPPYHFYNTTEFGLRRWFRDFDIDRCFVPDNMNPAYPLAWQCSELLRFAGDDLGTETRELLANTTLEQWRRWWADPSSRRGPAWDAMMALSQDVQRHLSGGFELRAHKP